MIVRSKHFEFDRDKSREVDQLAHDPAMNEAARDVIREVGEVQPFFTDAASHCFYCGEKLTIPAVMWNGRNGNGSDVLEIWLHPNCAEAFCARLSRDAEELEFGKERADKSLRDWKSKHS